MAPLRLGLRKKKAAADWALAGQMLDDAARVPSAVVHLWLEGPGAGQPEDDIAGVPCIPG